MIKTARHQLNAILLLLATSAIASPALSQESPRRANPAASQNLRAQSIPDISASEMIMTGITADMDYVKKQDRPRGISVNTYGLCRFSELGQSRVFCTNPRNLAQISRPQNPGDSRISTFAQREEDDIRLGVRPSGGRQARYLWCRFGPQGGSRSECAS